MKDFKNTEFVILDVETTGLSPAGGDRVIEIAAVKVRELRIVDKFYSLVNPQRPVSYAAFQVNGISDAMLKDAPAAGEILPGFLDFVSGACLVGHNIRFDLGFLSSELERAGWCWRQRHTAVDTVRLSRWLLPELRRHRLEYVARSLEIEPAQLHRAMSDVELTFRVFEKFLEMAFRRDVSDLPGLLTRGGVGFF